MMQGFISKVNAGIYDVYSLGKTYTCMVRKKNRQDGLSLMVGDNVIFDEKSLSIEKILPRFNGLIRPKVANIDQMIIIASLIDPAVGVSLINRFMMLIATANIKPILCISKIDRQDFPQQELNEIIELYEKLGYKVIPYSVVTKENIDKIKEHINKRKTVITGQTGVGKSKLINILLDKEIQKTGETSKALGRGKHTTRIVEYINLTDDTWICDTPGFSLIDFETIKIDISMLASEFPGFVNYLGKCKFRSCLHEKEPGCKIKEAVENNEIPLVHYQTYLQILNQIRTGGRK